MLVIKASEISQKHVGMVVTDRLNNTFTLDGFSASSNCVHLRGAGRIRVRMYEPYEELSLKVPTFTVELDRDEINLILEEYKTESPWKKSTGYPTGKLYEKLMAAINE